MYGRCWERWRIRAIMLRRALKGTVSNVSDRTRDITPRSKRPLPIPFPYGNALYAWWCTIFWEVELGGAVV